jgi:hypothetical protein
MALIWKRVKPHFDLRFFVSLASEGFAFFKNRFQNFSMALAEGHIAYAQKCLLFLKSRSQPTVPIQQSQYSFMAAHCTERIVSGSLAIFVPLLPNPISVHN